MQVTKYIKSDLDSYTSLKNKPTLYVKNLTKKYFGRPKPAVDNISFNVYPGEFHAFIGANGAGKTTTIKSIIGAYYNWQGTILINGYKNKLDIAKSKIGYIPENTRFPEKLSCYHYLVWMLCLSGFSSKDAKRIAQEKLVQFDMWKLRNKSPNYFSSGQKKKILLAQALAHDPDILIMDEPVANLDPKARGDFFKQINELKKQGKSIFISSHVLAELEVYFDSATILDGGKIVFSGTKEQLYSNFKNDTYSISTSNNKKLLAFLNKQKIKHTNNALDSTININNVTDKIKIAICGFLAKQKIIVENFSPVKFSLQDIYDKYTLKGSVDTMK